LSNEIELEIYKASKEDAEGILTYCNLIGGESDNLTFGENELDMTTIQEEEFIEGFHKSNTSLMLVGKINDEIVSVASISTTDKSRVAHNAEVGISVKRKYWNMGIGTKMMEKLINFAKQTKIIKVIHLGVRAENENAIHLYEKMGFEIIGVNKRFFKINDTYSDEILMNLYLE